MSKATDDVSNDVRQRIEYLRRRLDRIQADVDGGQLTPIHKCELNMKLAKMGAKLDGVQRAHDDEVKSRTATVNGQQG